MKNLAISTALALIACATPALAQEALTDRAALERDLRVLADDDMEGREAGTPGYDRAAAYVADRFQSLGLQPGGDDGGWLQHFTLVQHSAASDTRMALVGADGRPQKIEYGEDFVGGGFASAGDADGRGTVEAELVFVGHGLQIPSMGYTDLEGVDLEGKIAVWVFDLHEEITDPLLSMHLLVTGAERFANTGAVGSIMLFSDTLAQRIPFERARSFFGNVGSTTWVGPDGVAFDDGGDLEFSLVASPDLTRQLLAGTQFDSDALAAAQRSGGDMPAFDIGKTVRVDYANAYEELAQTSNVIAVQPGSDPAYADQYVVVTAHLDHEGLQEGHSDTNDQLFNGAMDNATGVSTMMEMARVMSQDLPKRPIMYVALGAEELGLLGSSYHARNQGIDDGSIVANVNVDMPILTWPFSDVVAFGADRSNLLAPVSAAVEGYGLEMVPDPNPDEGFFFRSDQYSYVRAGIPAVYVDLGFGNNGEPAQTDFLENHYHKPSDDASRLDFEQLGRFADVATLVAINVANMEERPAWRADDFFGDVFGGPVQ
ncbi:MAG: M28 family peptidase [Alteraurantiacibacter sp.]